jgi:acetyltransferase-like isoleucine patch superfamily enzyme
MITKIDARLLWCLRHFFYKSIIKRLDGIGYLGRPSFVKGLNRMSAGEGLGIFPGWRIEILNGAVNLGSNVRIGNNFFLNCGSLIEIGDNVTISANVFIGTTDVIINSDLNIPFRNWEEIEKPIRIGPNCFIGYGAVLLPGTILGEGCVVGANAVVHGEYRPGNIITGIPGRAKRNR